MTIARFSKPIAAVVTAGVFTAGFAPTTFAATGNTATPTIASTTALAEAKSEITVLANRVAALGDTSSAQQLDRFTAALNDPAATDIDIIGELKKLAKFLQPIVVEALRVGGPIAADVLESIAKLVSSIPGVGIGGPITEAVLKPIATLIRLGAPALADLIEKIEIEGVAKDDARQRFGTHLRGEGLPADSADAFAAALAEIYAS
ncbi:hypothetical protein [Amycolatopsis nigrescens]|uniref:hypothetical protein n=1 Tax=Amycolatopsis nigrescens TaxID=381445 RepID=UPI00036208E7|nr:hypothetical protein [Amycolatopsis nigrescens]